MSYLHYGHQAIRSLAVEMFAWIRRGIAGLLSPRKGRHVPGRRRRWWSRWLPLIVLSLSIVCQAVMLWLLGEVIDTCISLAELWLELAQKHLEITL